MTVPQSSAVTDANGMADKIADSRIFFMAFSSRLTWWVTLSSAGTLLQDRSCMHIERYRAAVLLFTEFIGLNRLEVEYQFFSADAGVVCQCWESAEVCVSVSKCGVDGFCGHRPYPFSIHLTMATRLEGGLIMVDLRQLLIFWPEYGDDVEATPSFKAVVLFEPYQCGS